MGSQIQIAAPRSTEYFPAEPKWLEANTQAEFYHHARLLGLPVLLEVITPAGRIDIAVLRSDRSGIVALVECKRNGRAIYGNSRQILRYKRIGVPVYGLNDFYRAERLVRTIQFRHANDVGVSWQQIKEITPLPRRTSYRR